MFKHFNYLILLVFFVLTSCETSKWSVSSIQSSKIAIDASTDSLADKSYIAYLQPIKSKVDAEMDVVIGQSAQNMQKNIPESLLSNLTADIYLQAASSILKEPVDIAIVNMGAILPSGKYLN